MSSVCYCEHWAIISQIYNIKIVCNCEIINLANSMEQIFNLIIIKKLQDGQGVQKKVILLTNWHYNIIIISQTKTTKQKLVNL